MIDMALDCGIKPARLPDTFIDRETDKPLWLRHADKLIKTFWAKMTMGENADAERGIIGAISDRQRRVRREPEKLLITAPFGMSHHLKRWVRAIKMRKTLRR